MNDYKELIENVRICASGDCFGCTTRGNKINCQEVLLESAADAIERLVKERDALLSLVNKLGKRYGPCDVCGADCPGVLDRDYQRKQALGFYGGDCPKWEWRGVRDDEVSE